MTTKTSIALVYIAFGSNLGDRAATIREALRRLQQPTAIRLLRVSPVYESAAEGFQEPAPPFLNGAVELEAGCSSKELLDILLRVENELGRVRLSRTEYQSRTIDLDLLLFGGEIRKNDRLIVPHPRMTQRGFVLRPLADLNPDLLIPGERITVRQALDRLEPLHDIRLTDLCVWNHP